MSRRARDAGFTTVELAVAMLVGGLVTAAVAMVFVQVTGTAREARTRMSLLADAQRGMEAMTRTVRAAVTAPGQTSALLVADTTTLTFHADLGRAETLTVAGVRIPSKVEYYFGGRCLYQAVTPARAVPGGYAWDTGRAVQCLLRTDARSSLFSYFTAGWPASSLTVPTGGLGTAARASVRSIGIGLTASDDAEAGTAATLTARIALINPTLRDAG